MILVGNQRLYVSNLPESALVYFKKAVKISAVFEERSQYRYIQTHTKALIQLAKYYYQMGEHLTTSLLLLHAIDNINYEKTLLNLEEKNRSDGYDCDDQDDPDSKFFQKSKIMLKLLSISL